MYLMFLFFSKEYSSFYYKNYEKKNFYSIISKPQREKLARVIVSHLFRGQLHF